LRFASRRIGSYVVAPAHAPCQSKSGHIIRDDDMAGVDDRTLTAIGAKGKQIETEAAPIRYVAELLGTDTDSERAIRWLIALIVLCCDPLAIALTAAASARR
jgi:hypothetical protein